MPRTSFKPSLHGFHFPNSFSSEEILAELQSVPRWLHLDDVWGLCGGMCFAALDRFFRQESMPSLTAPPRGGTILFSELLSRQIASVDSVGWSKILDYQIRPDEGRWYEFQHSLGHLSESLEWPSIRHKIDSGIPTTVCLIRSPRWNLARIGNNHQVVVYGYETDSLKVALNIYDPNFPDRDDVVLGFTLGQHDSRLDAFQTPGPDPRGFLRIPYDGIETAIQVTATPEESEVFEWIWTIFS